MGSRMGSSGFQQAPYFRNEAFSSRWLSFPQWVPEWVPVVSNMCESRRCVFCLRLPRKTQELRDGFRRVTFSSTSRKWFFDCERVDKAPRANIPRHLFCNAQALCTSSSFSTLYHGRFRVIRSRSCCNKIRRIQKIRPRDNSAATAASTHALRRSCFLQLCKQSHVHVMCELARFPRRCYPMFFWCPHTSPWDVVISCIHSCIKVAVQRSFQPIMGTPFFSVLVHAGPDASEY